MAENDFNPAQKPLVYDLLARLNTSLARVHRNLSQLEQVGIFDRRTMIRLYRASKEFQADANYHLIESPAEIEEMHWARYGKRGTVLGKIETAEDA